MARTAAVTIKDVAEAAGVSKTTAVCILNDTPHFKVPDATRRRVLDAAVRMGYRRNGVAAALSRGRIHTIGVVVPVYPAPENHPSFGTVYAKDVLIAVTNAAYRVGLRVTMMPYDDAAAVPIEELTDGRVDGLILVSPRDEAFADRIFATGFPCVSMGSGYADRLVRIDDRGGIRQAVDHLVSLGHRRIAFRMGDAPSLAAADRREGFLDAITYYSLRLEECPRTSDTDALLDILTAPIGIRPTAVVAYNDWRAFEVVEGVRRLGLRIPDDLSVIGFDNNVLAEACFPPLTTINNPLDAVAAEMIRALQSLWAGEEYKSPPAIPTSLVVRASTAPPPKKE